MQLYYSEQINMNLFFVIDISYTRIRKEALNMVLTLGKKLRDTKNTEQFDKMTLVIQKALSELTKDNEPEIRTRLIDIKEMFKI